jgi:hypothetical protein
MRMRRPMMPPQAPSGRCEEDAVAEWTDVAVAMVLPSTHEAVRVCAAMNDDVEVARASASASALPPTLTSPHRRLSYASGGEADSSLASCAVCRNDATPRCSVGVASCTMT